MQLPGSPELGDYVGYRFISKRKPDWRFVYEVSGSLASGDDSATFNLDGVSGQYVRESVGGVERGELEYFVLIRIEYSAAAVDGYLYSAAPAESIYLFSVAPMSEGMFLVMVGPSVLSPEEFKPLAWATRREA